MIKLFWFVILMACEYASFGQFHQLPSGHSQGDEIKYIRQLIDNRQIDGSIYDSEQVVLKLKIDSSSNEFLVDSIFKFRKFSANKIGFFCSFNDAASDIRFGYAEIIFSPYQTKVVLLNERIEKINAAAEQNNYKMFVHSSSYPRDGELTTIVYLIFSEKNKLFSIRTVSEKNKTVDGHRF